MKSQSDDPNVITDEVRAANGQAVDIRQVTLFDGTVVEAIDKNGIMTDLRGLHDRRFASEYATINAAYATFGAYGGKIYLPTGHYDLTTPLICTKRTILEGFAPELSVLDLAASSDFDPIILTAAMSRMENLQIDGQNTLQTVAHPLVRTQASDIKFENVWLYNSKGVGWQHDSGWKARFMDGWIETCDGIGFYCVPATNVSVNTINLFNVTLVNNAGGSIYVDLTNCTTSAFKVGWLFNNINANIGDISHTGVNMFLKDLQYSKFVNCDFMSQVNHAVSLNANASGSLTDLLFANCRFDVTQPTGGKYGLYIGDTNVRRVFLANCSVWDDVSDVAVNYIARGSHWLGEGNVPHYQPPAGQLKSAQAVAVGVNTIPGAVTPITPLNGALMNPHVKFTVANVTGDEIIRVIVHAHFDTGGSGTFAHAFLPGCEGDFWMREDDWLTIWKDNGACTYLELSASTDHPTTTATVVAAWRTS